MKLGIRLLDSQSSLNNLTYRNNVRVSPGETLQLVLQLVDLDTAGEINKIGNRIIPLNTATLNIEIRSVNNANILSKPALMKFSADDRSIWYVDLTAEETAKIGSVDIIATLTEGSSVRMAIGSQLIIPMPGNPYQC